MAVAVKHPDDANARGSFGSRCMGRVDRFCEQVGDLLNPILVKETRQALKSRQFVATFSLLLLAAVGWTIIGSLMLMPQIYTTPSAPRMLIGYYVVLAVPMLLVVPLAAYRSLEGELDDGTLELLSISALSPWQIVLGKLCSAMLQMLLYFVALFPCVAYAYTLRGVDLPTTGLMLGMLGTAAVLMTMLALMFAPLARSRTGRILTLLLVLSLLLAAEYFVGFLVIGMITYGNPAPVEWTVFLSVLVVTEAIALGYLLLSATAAQLMPESENRSTRLRVAFLGVTVVSVALAAYAMVAFTDASEPVFALMLMFLAALWTLGGSMFVAESPTMTPRIQRELPSTLLGRALLTFLTPGPATALIFVSLVSVALGLASTLAIQLWYFGNPDRMWSGTSFYNGLLSMAVIFPCYLITFLVVSRWLIALVRWKSNPRVGVGLTVFVVVAFLAAMVPYSVELYLADYNASSTSYSLTQVTNWVWTLALAAQDSITWPQRVLMGTFTTVLLLFHVAFLGDIVRPRRTATPARVLMERQEPGGQ